MTPRYDANQLIEFAAALAERAGLEADKSRAVAEILVEGDLLGHTTHGLHLLPLYLAHIEQGKMACSGSPQVVTDYPSAILWDGMRLPGPWLTRRAISEAVGRAKTQGICSVVVRRSHHLACLSAYLKPVADQGLLLLLSCSDPGVQTVAPHGGIRPVFASNPLAAAWPTQGDPVMLDVSQSISSNGLAIRLQAEGRRFPGPWAIDAHGQASDDPAVVSNQSAGALLPVGGLDHGHKGYAGALLVEALTGGLAGLGRADPSEGWTETTFILVLDPAFFGGREAFARQMEWVRQACLATPPRPGVERVRLPGENGLRRRETQLAHGVELYPGIEPALRPWAKKLEVEFPAALID